MMQPLKRLKRELVTEGSVLKIYKDTVEVNGRICAYDFLKHDGAAAVVPVLPDGRILMVRQYRNALDRFTLEIPAGKVDSPDEPRIACAARELEEETGYCAGALDFLIRVDTFVAFCDEQIDIFVARDLKKTAQHLDEDEDICVEAWTAEDLLEQIYSGAMRDSKTVAAILAYAGKYKSRAEDHGIEKTGVE